MSLRVVISTFGMLSADFQALTSDATAAADALEAGVSKSLGSAELDSAGSDVIEHFADLLSTMATSCGGMSERVSHTMSELLQVDEINAVTICDVTDGQVSKQLLTGTP